MSNKKIIRAISLLGLICSLASLLTGFPPSSPTRVTASINPNTSPLTSLSLDSNGLISDVRADMDEEGNLYYVWQKIYVNSSLQNCNGIFYQVYNKAGIPITQESLIEESCNGTASYGTPDLSVNATNFVVVFTKEITPAQPQILMTVVDTEGDYSVLQAPQVVDDGLILDTNSRPRVASNPDGDSIAITFAACDDMTCQDHDIYFQGYFSTFAKAHASNVRINSVTDNDQQNANISYSGLHYLIVYDSLDSSGSPTLYTVHGMAINHTANNQSATLLISGDTASSPDVAGTRDTDYLLAPPHQENFYVTYINNIGSANPKEVNIKKIHCLYDSAIPGDYSCASTSRAGEPIFARVNEPSTDIQPQSPQITAFKSRDNLMRTPPYQNTDIDYLSVAWNELGNDRFDLKIRNYTDTLASASEIINAAEDIDNGTAIASNRDGHFTITYLDGLETTAKLYPTKFLRLDEEKNVNAPDTRAQEKTRVAKNSNGDYIVVYQSFNGTDYDIIFALYNKYGNPIKNTTLVNTTISGDQINPEVAYWNESTESPDYGKFIIVWEGNGTGDTDGIFYQIFNADATPDGTEILVNQNTSAIQESPDLSTGQHGQTAIVYRESTGGVSTIMLNYLNDANSITSSLSTNASDIRSPQVALSPNADGISGNSKFFASWRDDESGYLTSGFLSSATTVTNNGAASQSHLFTDDLDGAYNTANSTFTPARDAFFYTRTVFKETEINGGPKLEIGFYGSAEIYQEDLDMEDVGNRVTIDPATQNIMVIGQKIATYQPNANQVILFPANNPIGSFSGTIYDGEFTQEANVLEANENYIFINNASQPFLEDTEIGTANEHTVTVNSPAKILTFSTDVSTHFTLNSTVTDTTSGATGTVVGIGSNHINLEGITGVFSASDVLDNAPYNDTVDSVDPSGDTYNVHLAAGAGLEFEEGNTISNDTLTKHGVIDHRYPDFLNVNMSNLDVFGNSEIVLDFNYVNTSVNDPIEYIAGQFFHFEVDETTNTPLWKVSGPTFAVSEQSYYGQTFQSADAAYDTRSTDEQGKFIATSYTTSGNDNYIDANGVYQQRTEDPFSPGQPEDLSPTTEQQITPGGKYIIVPETIDFGVVNRNQTGTVDLADLNPSCLRITDLDGTEFDLTVSLTDLENTSKPGPIIDKSNFIIENNDGINPDISNLATFSSTTDVTLSPSTNPGENANLGTPQTLLSKNNQYTGSWKICPRAMLTIPANANSGTYSGTLTFTLI